MHILPNLVTKPPKTLTGEGESLTGKGKPLTVRQVSVTHCMDLHHKLRHKPFMANRVLEVIHTAYNLAMKMKWVDENLEQVGQLLGHTQAQTTRRYAWLLTGAATAAAEVVATQIKRSPH